MTDERIERTAAAQPAKCPTCGSRQPHLHPAVQVGGEVELCTDGFHLRQTPQNGSGYIEAVKAKILRLKLENGQ